MYINEKTAVELTTNDIDIIDGYFVEKIEKELEWRISNKREKR